MQNFPEKPTMPNGGGAKSGAFSAPDFNPFDLALDPGLRELCEQWMNMSDERRKVIGAIASVK